MKVIIGTYEGTLHPEENGQTGGIELDTDGKGDRNRLERKGRTKGIVKDKLGKDVAELEAGIDTSDSFTVENVVRDWLTRGTKGLSDKTVNDYRSLADSDLIRFIGAHKLKALTAHNKSKHWCRINLLHAMHSGVIPWCLLRSGSRSSTGLWRPGVVALGLAESGVVGIWFGTGFRISLTRARP
jgi:hypothetical protein